MNKHIPKSEYEGLAESGSAVKGKCDRPLMLTRTLSGERDGVDHRPLWRWLLDVA